MHHWSIDEFHSLPFSVAQATIFAINQTLLVTDLQHCNFFLMRRTVRRQSRLAPKALLRFSLSTYVLRFNDSHRVIRSFVANTTLNAWIIHLDLPNRWYVRNQAKQGRTDDSVPWQISLEMYESFTWIFPTDDTYAIEQNKEERMTAWRSSYINWHAFEALSLSICAQEKDYCYIKRKFSLN